MTTFFYLSEYALHFFQSTILFPDIIIAFLHLLQYITDKIQSINPD